MALHGPDVELEPTGDLLERQALGEEHDDLELTRRQQLRVAGVHAATESATESRPTTADDRPARPAPGDRSRGGPAMPTPGAVRT